MFEKYDIMTYNMEIVDYCDVTSLYLLVKSVHSTRVHASCSQAADSCSRPACEHG